MSRRNLGDGILAILDHLGIHVDPTRVEEERQLHPEDSTVDIVARLSLAPQDKLDEAIRVAKETGDSEFMLEQLARARRRVVESRAASARLTEVATAIAKK
jgi:hypothetical protein